MCSPAMAPGWASAREKAAGRRLGEVPPRMAPDADWGHGKCKLGLCHLALVIAL